MINTPLFSFYEILNELGDDVDFSYVDKEELHIQGIITEERKSIYSKLVKLLGNNYNFAELADPETTSEDIKIGKLFNLTIILSFGSDNLYLDVEQYLERCHLQDIPPELFFIRNLQFYNSTISNEKVALIQKIQEFMNKLENLADFCISESNATKKLIFVDKDSSSNHISISTKCSSKILECSKPNTTLLDDLFSKESDFSKKEKYIFRNSLIDFLKNTDEDPLFILISKWEEFEKLFGNNLQASFNDFNFHRTLQQIANETLKLSELINKLGSELILKMLSIPVVMIVTFGFFDQFKVDEADWFIVIGTGFTSFLTTYLLKIYIENQHKNAFLLIQQKRNIFVQFKFSSDQKSTEVKNKIRYTKKRTNKLILDTLKILSLYKALSYLPMMTWVIYFIFVLANYFLNFCSLVPKLDTIWIQLPTCKI